MKIQRVTDEFIEFDNGNKIEYKHEQDCCEDNYADFENLTERNVNYYFDFDEDLTFEFIDGMGFRFGSKPKGLYGLCNDYMRWIFIPCYSFQNGWYSTGIDIYYKGEIVLRNGECEEHLD